MSARRSRAEAHVVATEKTTALVLRTTDFSETSRVLVLWTREFGKVRALAKGARRLRGAFESALDLLNCCDIVLIRKTSGALDLLTEARLRECFSHLRGQLQAYYAASLIAEILSICAQENDPHPDWFDQTITTLRELGGQEVYAVLLHWELRALREVGLQPVLDHCVQCRQPFVAPVADSLTWSAVAGGLVCPRCHVATPGRRQLPRDLFLQLRHLVAASNQTPRAAHDRSPLTLPPQTCLELLHLLHEYWMHQLGQPLHLAVYFQPIQRSAGQ